LETKSDVPIINTCLPFVPLTWDRKIARWISRLASPPLLAAFGIFLVALQSGQRDTWFWASLSILLSILLPVLYILFLVKTRRITDFDVYRREQRFWPYLFTLSCGITNCVFLAIYTAPTLLLILALAGVAQTLLMFIITFWWKISAHAAASASFAMLTWLIGGSAFATSFILIPLVAWSRVRLHRHTLGQTIAGSILGLAVFTLAAILV
jgi:membrane-associated phospholipid phosphatase